MKSIVITGDSAFESLYKYTKIENADLKYAYYGSKSKLLSGIRVAWIKLNLPGKKFWYRKIDFSSYEKIIVLDTFIDSDYLVYLRNNAKAVKEKHLYFWNVYKNSRLDKNDIERNGFKIWSFDYNDCIEQGFSYNPQFYAQSWYEFAVNEPTVDVTFVGRDKDDRVKKVDEIFNSLREKGISCNTYITARKWYQRFKSKRYQKYLDLRGMIQKECEGRVVLDYGVSYQFGPTLRVYDAICNKRKVITNNSGVKELNFYSRDNFFILGEDNENEIEKFILEPFISTEKEQLEYYKVQNWVNRFQT